MNPEKLKQMGRDYFAANGPLVEIPSRDDNFWKAWEAYEVETSLKGDAKETEYVRWKALWWQGYNEAAASKEIRAIELLGRLYMDTRLDQSGSEAWADAGAFLTEIGWKPKA